VYVVGLAASTPRGTHAAALLACGEGSLLSHDSAIELWISQWRGREDGIIDVTICGRQSGRPAGVRLHRTRHLERRDVRVVSGLPVTSPARTLLDLAEVVTPRELERAFDEALDRNIMRLSEVRDALARARGRRGVPLLRALLDRDHHNTMTRSEGEERLLALVRHADLPTPELNVGLHGYLVDALWREHRVVVEVDGWDFHSSRSAFERDRAKGAKLTAMGYDVIRVTVRQLKYEAYVVIGRLAKALAWAEARLAG
jgi:very-short-patch-repair endonuclease